MSTIKVRADKVPVHLVNGHEPRPRKLIKDDKLPGGVRDLAFLYPGDPPIDVDEEARYYAKRLAAGDLVKVEAAIVDSPAVHTSATRNQGLPPVVEQKKGKE